MCEQILINGTVKYNFCKKCRLFNSIKGALETGWFCYSNVPIEEFNRNHYKRRVLRVGDAPPDKCIYKFEVEFLND